MKRRRAALKCFIPISVIDSVNLASVDLNLLVAFEALLAERNFSARLFGQRKTPPRGPGV
jgi:hypothetical protein